MFSFSSSRLFPSWFSPPSNPARTPRVKLDTNMPKTIAINCLILGDTEEEIFVVEIPVTKTVSALRKVIKTERPGIFGDVDAVKITLCTAFKPYDDIKDLTELPKPNLKALSRIDKVFAHLAPDEVHAIIKAPETASK
jgi:Crinkler effector protein N-terminal domain